MVLLTLHFYKIQTNNGYLQSLRYHLLVSIISFTFDH